jgi:UPF0716 protein FxsA
VYQQRKPRRDVGIRADPLWSTYGITPDKPTHNRYAPLHCGQGRPKDAADTMKFIFLFVFILVPLAEIAVFIKVGEVIGLAATVALVIATAVIGVALLKRQGLAALARAQQSVDAGELPVDSVVDGVALLLAGAFLLTPGLITDTAGFLLLVPAFRHGIARWIMARVKESGQVKVWTSQGPAKSSDQAQRPTDTPPPGTIIEGEFEEVDEPGEPNEDSPWRK